MLLDKATLENADTAMADAVYPDADAPGELVGWPERVRVGNAEGVAITVRVSESGKTFMRRSLMVRTAEHAYRIELESPEGRWGSFQAGFAALAAGFQLP